MNRKITYVARAETTDIVLCRFGDTKTSARSALESGLTAYARERDLDASWVASTLKKASVEQEVPDMEYRRPTTSSDADEGVREIVAA